MNTKPGISHTVIKQLLNTSLARLGQPALARLRDARAQALARHNAHRVVPSLSLVGSFTWLAAGTHYKSQLLVATVLAIAILFSVVAYQQQQAAENDVAEVDISILTDDLPMHVYLD